MKHSYSRETRELVKGLRPIDDTFFILLGRRKEVCQEILRTLLEDTQLEVLSSETQVLHGGFERSITIDCKCCLSGGRIVNIEMQKDRKNDDIRRTRFHAAVITAGESPKGSRFGEIPDVIVIYISEYDALYNGQTFTMARRCIWNHGIWEPIEDGECICYVNTAPNQEAWSDKKELMSLLVRADAFESPKFTELSKAVRYFKQEEGGHLEMCQAVEEYANKKKAEGIQLGMEQGIEQGIEIVVFEMVQEGDLSMEKGAKRLGVSVEEFVRRMVEKGYQLSK